MKRILVPVGRLVPAILMFLNITTLTSWSVLKTPWRSKSFAQHKPACAFCSEILSNHPDRYYILAKRPRYMIQLAPKPYGAYHLMIVPYHHTDSPTKISDSSWAACWQGVKEVVEVLSHNLGIDSFNIGMNIGEHGAGSKPDHLHIHIVPRFKEKGEGFMEIVANTRMLDEMLCDMYKRLKPLFRGK